MKLYRGGIIVLFYRIVRAISYPFLSLIFPTKIIGKNNFIHEKAVICCNHYSSLDSILVATKLMREGCHCIGKEEAFKSKISGWFLRKMGGIPIKRGENDLVAYRKILNVLKSGKQLLIFPEGTRNKSECADIAPFHTGAALFSIKSNAPIIPILLYGKPRPFKKNFIIIGEPFSLEKFASLPSREMKEKATEELYSRMFEMQKNFNNMIQSSERRLLT
ncbi:MAG: 1-acyl-sn-glycerol-3-phosphate acyltransferase [Clostridia bacterium]|nr:1-acyl-sn-glycerol-3-phosphate acyltransferase [Clostridia bacterium]